MCRSKAGGVEIVVALPKINPIRYNLNPETSILKSVLTKFKKMVESRTSNELSF